MLDDDDAGSCKQKEKAINVPTPHEPNRVALIPPDEQQEQAQNLLMRLLHFGLDPFNTLRMELRDHLCSKMTQFSFVRNNS